MGRLTEPDRAKALAAALVPDSLRDVEEGAGMYDETQHCEAVAPRARALKVRIAGIATTGLVVSLAVVPDALARIALNHSETVLALSGAPAEEDLQ